MQQDAAEFTAAVVTGKEFIRMGKQKKSTQVDSLL
jgi:hypothetical protein